MGKDNKQQKKETMDLENFHQSDYKKTDEQSKGLAVTHEQVSDTFTKGTIDGKVDQVDEEGNLISHEGEEIQRKRKEMKRSGHL
ncbi:YozQ family protein [Salipaludibacillus daqingensis]|uniref:YozQ family protein n=1 Tax=Salipaludibacillus daqingensis TaxID=3041001 RepID=UPI00247518CF|nr:YozQ family protein [Salipaludibacillus daqingensis]